MIKLFSFFVAIVMLFTTFEADAKRIGGGSSMGRQSSQVTQREAARAPAAANPTTAGAAAGGAAAATKKPWGAMLGGLAAGLGLAWLANSLGFGEGFANMLAILLLVMVALAVFRMFRNRGAGVTNPGAMSYQGAGPVATPNTYNPKNVGNDAAARPWEQGAQGTQFSGSNANGGSMIGAGLGGGSALSGSQTWGVPADFDTEGFLSAAKRNFVTLQAAWDRADLHSLRNMMTDGMMAEIQSQLAERQQGHVNHTEVVSLDAQLLGIEELPEEYMASVEFNGMIREDGAAPTPFREVWNMTKRKSDGGWLVAGLQALH